MLQKRRWIGYRAMVPVILVALSGCRETSSATALVAVVPNDNRVAGGEMRGDTLVFALNAQLAAWKPDFNVDTAMTVQAFTAGDRVPRIPGPLLRVTTGTVVELRVTNSLADSTLVVHGLRPGFGVASGAASGADADTMQVRPGETRVAHFTATTAGTYVYWGRTQGERMERSEIRDGPLAGAIVIDDANVPRDTSERIFVITTLDILPDSTITTPQSDLFDLAINGLSWPFTETLTHEVGDSVRWRWINATATPHPMHLHGYHFRVFAKGNGAVDTMYAPDMQRTAVTEYLPAGATTQLRWVPTRAGNWLFHCHIAPHVVPFPIRPDSVRMAMDMSEAGMADVQGHMARAMTGLVMGIEVRERGSAPTPPVVGRIVHHLRIFAQQSSAPPVADTAYVRGYVLQTDARVPKTDSVVIPGPVLVLYRGQRTAITVINHLPEPTSVHWHGMELESYYDGVVGWSGADSKRSPLIAPRDSFVAVMSPPRAGTFMYHPHMDEEDQLYAGMYGPMIVLEPGARFDPTTDLVFMMGEAIVDGKRGETLNGARHFAPLQLKVGITYRLRFLNMNAASPGEILLHTDSVPLRWNPLAKDGADLLVARRTEQPSRLARLGVGETYDFTWRPTQTGNAVLEVKSLDADSAFRVPIILRQ